MAGTTHNTFKDACVELGLFPNDKEFMDAIIEVSHLASGNHLRRLFVMLLYMDSMTNPFVVWEATWKILCDVLLYDTRKRLSNQCLQISDDDLRNLCLIEIEKLLSMNGKSLDNIEYMPQTSNSETAQFQNGLLAVELNYDKEELAATHMSLMLTLTTEQMLVYDQTYHSVMTDSGGLIICDEAPMLNRFCSESIYRSLRNIMRNIDDSNKYKTFGGKVIVFGGDFRQISPVFRKGCRNDIVSASINSSKLWKYCKVLTLSKNMRLSDSNLNGNSNELKWFADWLLDIGNGNLYSNESGESIIDIPNDLLVTDSHNPLLSLFELTYPILLENMNNLKFYKERPLLSPTHDVVDFVNDFVLSLLSGDENVYLSADSIVISDENSRVQADWFTPEFLNDMKCSEMPNHRLRLKIGVPLCC